ncbi:FecR domain-containing protein [Bdellovibrio sp. HCB337]|uniref:FecR domain-containing protein n=1 Tax=Bdellovibrio sp. HCB337 TaxID=3394358 RepID=UPI0039A56D7C
MSVFNRFSTTDRIILSGSVVILLALSYLLYDDSLIFPKNTSNEPLIGTISSSNNDVRRKNSGNFIWLPGNKKDQVFNKDSIFTGDGSEAQIQLSDGSVIQIQENSLVNLNLKNGQMELDLRFGQFTGNGNSPIRIKTGSEEYTIQGKDAKFEINRSQTGDLDVKVLSGDAEITGKNGKQKLQSNEALQITKKGIEKGQVEAKVRLITKNDIYMYRAADKLPLAFEWEGRGPIGQYEIEIAKTEDFKKVLALRTTAEQKISVKDSLKEGPYFWRVKGLDSRRKHLATSTSQKFYLSYMMPPQVVTPTDKATVKVEALSGPTGLQANTKITWQADERHKNYQWQLSRSADFSDILVEKDAWTPKEVITPNLRSGPYFTRVRGYDKDKHPSPWSKPHAFTFEVNAEVKPPAPRLVEKRIRFQMPKTEDRAPSAANSPQMAWTDVDVAKDYRFEISKSPRFTGAQVVETENTRTTWTQYKPGKHYFRVYTRTALGQSSDPSETGVIEVYGDAPVLGGIPSTLIKETNINAVPPEKEVRVTWSSIPDAQSYLVQMDKSPTFENPVQQEVNTTDGTVRLPEPGKYFVRVKALGEGSQDMSEFSNVQDTTYVFKKTLKAPELIEPYDKTTVFLQKDMEPLIWLEWAAVQDATKYHVEVSSDASFSRIVMSKTLGETRFLVREKIPYGNIYWRIRALGPDESLNSDWADRQFMIHHQKNRGF